MVQRSWRNDNGNNLNKKMKNNINPKTNPITTILGAVLLTIGLGSFIMPMFLELREDLNIYLKAAFTLSGFLCLLAPDALVGIVTDALKKFLSNKNNAAILLLGFCTFLIACAPKPPIASEENKTKDSIYVKEITRVDTVNVAGDSVRIYVQNPCDNGSLTIEKPIVKKSKRAVAIVSKDTKGNLAIDCECTSEQLLINSKNKEIYHLHSVLNNKVIEKEVYKTYWYDKACRWWTVISLLALLLVLVYGIWHLLK